MKNLKRLFSIALVVLMVVPMVLSTAITSAADAYSVCELNGEEYDTLAEALADATSGDTIKLLADVTDEQFTVPKNMSLVLDLNGFTIDYEDGYSINVWKNNSTLTITGAGVIGDSGNTAVRVYGSTAKVVFADTFTGKVESLVVTNSTVEINGGLFKDGIDIEKYIADGMTVVASSEDGYNTISSLTSENACVAIVNGSDIKYYTNITKAVAEWASADGNVLKLLKDVELGGLQDATLNGQSLTVDLNGKTWKFNNATVAQQMGIRLTGTGDVLVTGGGSMVYDSEYGTCQIFDVNVTSSVNITVDNATITTTGSNAAIDCGGNFTLVSGTVSGVACGGNFTMTGGTITGTANLSDTTATATISGGAINTNISLGNNAETVVTITAGYVNSIETANTDINGSTVYISDTAVVNWLVNGGKNYISGGAVTSIVGGENYISGGVIKDLYFHNITEEEWLNDPNALSYREATYEISGGHFSSNSYITDKLPRKINQDVVDGKGLVASSQGGYVIVDRSFSVTASDNSISIVGAELNGDIKDAYLFKGDFADFTSAFKARKTVYYYLTVTKITEGDFDLTEITSGTYTVFIRYNDVDIISTKVTVTDPTPVIPEAPAFTVGTNGLEVTMTGADVKAVRVAPVAGLTTISEIKAATGYRGISSTLFTENSYSKKFAEGTYSYVVEFTNGATSNGEFVVAKAAVQTGITFTATQITGIGSDIKSIRVAKGTYSTASEIKANLCVSVTPAYVTDGIYNIKMAADYNKGGTVPATWCGPLSGTYTAAITYTNGTVVITTFTI